MKSGSPFIPAPLPNNSCPTQRFCEQVLGGLESPTPKLFCRAAPLLWCAAPPADQSRVPFQPRGPVHQPAQEAQSIREDPDIDRSNEHRVQRQGVLGSRPAWTIRAWAAGTHCERHSVHRQRTLNLQSYYEDHNK